MASRSSKMLLQGFDHIGAISWERLFGEVIEQVANEGAMSCRVVGHIIDNVTGARQSYGFALIIGEFTDGIHWFMIVFGSPAADGIKVFKTEAQRVDG